VCCGDVVRCGVWCGVRGSNYIDGDVEVADVVSFGGDNLVDDLLSSFFGPKRFVRGGLTAFASRGRLFRGLRDFKVLRVCVFRVLSKFFWKKRGSLGLGIDKHQLVFCFSRYV